MSDSDKERAAFAELAVHFEQATDEIMSELRAIRSELVVRPTRTEQTARRRASVVLLVALGFMALMVNDKHVNACSPGARSVAAVEYLSSVAPEDYSDQRLRELLNRDLPATCDVTYPVEDHNSEGWPTPANLLGLALYLGLFVVLFFWMRDPLRRERRERRNR